MVRQKSCDEGCNIAGYLLSKYSDRLIALAADALAAMRDLQNIKTGQMFIGASQTTGVYILPRLIGRSLTCRSTREMGGFRDPLQVRLFSSATVTIFSHVLMYTRFDSEQVRTSIPQVIVRQMGTA